MTDPVFSGQNRIVVDWDGTCVPQVWPGEPRAMFKGCSEALRAFLSAGYEVVIFSTRLAPRDLDEVTPLLRADKERQVRYIRHVLDVHGLHEVGIWRKPWKPGALFYIDDKGIRFDGNWQAVQDVVLSTST